MVSYSPSCPSERPDAELALNRAVGQAEEPDESLLFIHAYLCI